MKIALDVMGTDYGPKELVLGAVQAVKEFNCEIVLVGDPETIENLLREYKPIRTAGSAFVRQRKS